MTLVRNAVDSRTRASRKAALGPMAAVGVSLVTTEMGAFEGRRAAAVAPFREMPRVVK
jgi:hypothetical protein